MATAFLSTANTFYTSTPSSSPSSSSSSSSSSSPSSSPLPRLRFACLSSNNTRNLIICKEHNDPPSQGPIFTKRNLSISFISSFVFPLVGANAAILEADDDEELLEKVKKDRKKRLERQGVISAANKETGYLQELVYKLSKVAEAIDNNDFSTASSVLGGSDADWVQKANLAFNKLSSSSDEKSQVDTFNASLASLISSVSQNDVGSSKVAFVASASALEKWTALTGLNGQLKGL